LRLPFFPIQWQRRILWGDANCMVGLSAWMSTKADDQST
jgi:hypothetical protein